MTENWVVDTSVLIQAYIDQNDSPRVITLLKRMESPFPAEIHYPEIGLVECTNVLWKQVRFHGTAVEEAQVALANLKSLSLTVYSSAPLLERALEIGLAHRLAVYDSVYIALAESLEYPLITVDKRQHDAPQL